MATFQGRGTFHDKGRDWREAKARLSSRRPVLYLLVGPPGSGKSTAAAGLSAFGSNPHGTLLFSTDDCFVHEREVGRGRKYVFTNERDEDRLHLLTLNAVRRAAAQATSKPDLVVHNTFLYYEQREPYYQIAKESGYDLRLLLTKRSLDLSPPSKEQASLRATTPLARPVSFYAAANQHRVPVQKLEEMVSAFARFLRGEEGWSLFGEAQLGEEYAPLFFCLAELLVAGSPQLSSCLHRLQDLLSAWNPKEQAFGEQVARLMTFLAELEAQAHLPTVERRVRGLTLFCQHFLHFRDSCAPVWFYRTYAQYTEKAESCFWNGKNGPWLADLWNLDEKLTLASCYTLGEILPFCTDADLEFLFLVLCARCSREHDASGTKTRDGPIPSAANYERSDHLRSLLKVFLHHLVYQDKHVTVARAKQRAVIVLCDLTKCSQSSFRAGDGDRNARLEVKSGADKGELRLFSCEYREEELREIARLRFAPNSKKGATRRRLVALAPKDVPSDQSPHRSEGALMFYREDALYVPAGSCELCFLCVPCEDLRQLLS